MATNERDMIASRMCQWLATRLDLYVVYNTLFLSLYGKRYRSLNQFDIILWCVVKPNTLFTQIYRLNTSCTAKKWRYIYMYIYLEIYLEIVSRERESIYRSKSNNIPAASRENKTIAYTTRVIVVVYSRQRKCVFEKIRANSRTTIIQANRPTFAASNESLQREPLILGPPVQRGIVEFPRMMFLNVSQGPHQPKQPGRHREIKKHRLVCASEKPSETLVALVCTAPPDKSWRGHSRWHPGIFVDIGPVSWLFPLMTCIVWRYRAASCYASAISLTSPISTISLWFEWFPLFLPQEPFLRF